MSLTAITFITFALVVDCFIWFTVFDDWLQGSSGTRKSLEIWSEEEISLLEESLRG
jgi:hypothetical protein